MVPAYLQSVLIAVAVYLVLYAVERRYGDKWFGRTLSENEHLTIDVLIRQNQEKDDQLAQLRSANAQCIEQIRALTDEVKRLESKVATLTQELSDRQVIDARPQTASQIRVLLIAPHSDLPLVDAETQDVLRSGLTVTPVFSPVTQLSLTREMRRGEYDGLWLAGHMDAQGNFLLDNGELLPPAALTSLVRGRFRWVYLNTCTSVFAAQTLQNETNADVVCTLLDVPDADAYRTGSLFASALSELRDVRAAYEESRPGGNRIYLFLGGRGKK